MTPSDRHLSDVLHATQAVIELRQERERAVVASPWIRNELDPVSRERASEDLEKDVAGWLAAREGAE